MDSRTRGLVLLTDPLRPTPSSSPLSGVVRLPAFPPMDMVIDPTPEPGQAFSISVEAHDGQRHQARYVALGPSRQAVIDGLNAQLPPDYRLRLAGGDR